jgi:hypothetical protein
VVDVLLDMVFVKLLDILIKEIDMNNFVKWLTILSVCVFVGAAVATNSISPPKQETAQLIRQAGIDAFINEVNLVQRTEGMTRTEAKDHVWEQWNAGSGVHYQDIIINAWHWKSWYGYSTLFGIGCAARYMLC